MIIGSGIDLVEIPRIQLSIDRYGSRFLNRIYTEGEQAYCLRKRSAAESFAARFAAKEAGAKALAPESAAVSHGSKSRWSAIPWTAGAQVPRACAAAGGAAWRGAYRTLDYPYGRSGHGQCGLGELSPVRPVWYSLAYGQLF